MTTHLAELRSRLSEVTGPDIRLDEEIWFTLLGRGPEPMKTIRYTASIEAALGLVAQKLPGWGYYLRRDGDGCGCGLVPAGCTSVTTGHETAPTPPLAILLALVSAIQAQEGGL